DQRAVADPLVGPAAEPQPSVATWALLADVLEHCPSLERQRSRRLVRRKRAEERERTNLVAISSVASTTRRTTRAHRSAPPIFRDNQRTRDACGARHLCPGLRLRSSRRSTQAAPPVERGCALGARRSEERV